MYMQKLGTRSLSCSLISDMLSPTYYHFNQIDKFMIFMLLGLYVLLVLCLSLLISMLNFKR